MESLEKTSFEKRWTQQDFGKDQLGLNNFSFSESELLKSTRLSQLMAVMPPEKFPLLLKKLGLKDKSEILKITHFSRVLVNIAAEGSADFVPVFEIYPYFAEALKGLDQLEVVGSFQVFGFPQQSDFKAEDKESDQG